MSRRVKEFIDVSDFASLDDLIGQLVSIRDSLPAFSEAELRMKGDDVFGRKMAISYMREQTAEEAACDGRYRDAIRAAQQRELERLQRELGVVCHLPTPKRRMRRAA